MNTEQYQTSEQLYNRIKPRMRPCFYPEAVQRACSNVIQIQTQQRIVTGLLDEPLVCNDPHRVAQVNSVLKTVGQALVEAKRKLQSYLTQEEE